MTQAALPILETRVAASWVDYNGHMGDFAYGIVFSNAATSYMDRLGIDATYRQQTAATLYTLDSRIGFLKECHEADWLRVDVTVLDADSRRMHLFMSMHNKAGEDLAFCEQVLMHVSRQSGSPRATIMPEEAQRVLTNDLEAHRALERPAWLERQIGLKR